MLVSVIVPQHGGSELTVAAVASLQRHHPQTSCEIVIVDDGSAPGHVRGLQARLSGDGVRIVPLADRGGTTRAWNVGASHAQGDVLVFLNNDTVTHGPWLERFVNPLAGGDSLLVGCGRRQERDLPAMLRSGTDAPLLLEGWCLGILRDAFDRLGGFDERLRLYFSDTDLQCRIRSRHPTGGLAAVTGLPIEHLGHASTRRLLKRRQIWREDRRRFHAKWSGKEPG